MPAPVNRLDNNQRQDAVDKLLKDLAPLMDPGVPAAQKLAAEGTISLDLGKLPAALQQQARDAYYNPKSGMSKEQSLMTFLQQNMSNETLYSLSHTNKGLASQYAPSVMQGAMTTFGGQSGAEAQQSASTIRRALTDMGMSDAQSMELLYRMNSKQLTPMQQQDLTARLNRGEGLSAIAAYYPDQMASFISDNPGIQNSMAMYLSRPENEALAQQMLPYMSDAVAQQMGIGDQSLVKSFLSGAKDMLGMPSHVAMGLLTNTQHFFKELFDITPEYTKNAPLGEQAYNRVLSNTRLKYAGQLREIQKQAGVQNLMDAFGSFGLDKGTAELIADVMNSQAAEMGFSAVKNQLTGVLGNAGLDETQASAIMNGIEQNFRGLVSGFQGDYGAVMNMATAGTHDRRAIEQYGLMATHLATIKPTLENKFMRADNYRSALAGMLQDGYRPDFLVTHHDQDMYRQAAKMSTAQRDHMRNEMIASEKEWSNKKWASMTDQEKSIAMENIKNSKLQWERNKYFTDDNTLKEGVSAQDAYGAFENARIANNADFVMGALEGTPGEIQEKYGKLEGSGVERMKAGVKNQVGASYLENIMNERATIETNFQNVRMGVRDDTGFLAKFQGDEHAKNRQLIRIFGGADVNQDYGTQASRAGSTIMMGDMAGMTIERTASLVSETGKLAQQFGLKGDAAQVAGNLAASMVMAAQLQPHTGPIDQNRLQAFASQNAASIATSQNSRNLVFLMNETFKEGSKMQKLKEKLLRGEQLDPNELKDITIESLQKDYTGSAANFASHMSDAVYQQRFSSMTAEQQYAYNLNAPRAEQDRFREMLKGGAYSEIWQSGVSASNYSGNVEQLYEVRRQLLGKIAPDRVAKILSGEEPTAEEQKIIEKMGLGDQIKSIQGNVLNAEGFLSDFNAADAAWANQINPNATINDIDVGMKELSPAQAAAAARAQDVKEKLPVNFDLSIMEAFAQTGRDPTKDNGSRLGMLGKNLLQGGKVTAADAKAALDQYGAYSILNYASAGTQSFQQIAENLELTKEETTDLLKQMGVTPNEGESEEEALWRALSGANKEQLQAYSETFKNTTAGKRILERIGADIDKADKALHPEDSQANTAQDSAQTEESESTKPESAAGASGSEAPSAAQPQQKIPMRTTGGGEAVAVYVMNPTGKEDATVPEKQQA